MELPEQSTYRSSMGPPPSQSRSQQNDSGDRQSALTDNIRLDVEERGEFFHQVIVAIDKSPRNTVGCAYYSAQQGCLFCMEDMPMGGIDMFDSLMVELEPTTVIVSPRVGGSCGTGIDAWMREENSLFGTSHPLPFELTRRPPSDFRYENAIKQLIQCYNHGQGKQVMQFMVPGVEIGVDVPSALQGIDHNEDRGKLLAISAYIELENKISVGCIGSILAYVQRHEGSAIDHLSHPGVSLKLKMFSLKDLMLVSSDTIASLQVIDFESHPNAAKQGPGCSGAKESLSVYGLFRNLARTSQGKTRLRQMFLRPLMNLVTITIRLEFIAICSSATNYPTSERMSKSLTKVRDLSWTMRNIRKGVENTGHHSTSISSSVWSILIEFCYHAIDLANHLSELVGVVEQSFLHQAMQKFDKDQLHRVGKLIFDTVDLEETTDQQRTVIRRGLSNDLDQVKDAYNGMDSLLSRVACELSNTIPKDSVSSSLNVVFFPQLGFHIAIPHDPFTGQHMEQMPASDWKPHFSTERHLFLKNDTMRRMDIELGDLWGEICAKEIEMSYDLAQEVLCHEEMLLGISETCGELDALLALVHGAVQYQLTRPSFVLENVIDIKGGRHILQELTVPAFIPNDTLLVGGDDHALHGPSMIILTGPNYSGKSVYQKQVALIIYLAQVGSFVPAEAAKLGLTDKILTRIATRESATRTQSAFLIDLQQISRALHSCTNRSLVIVDEFGKGTNTCDGAAIAAATLEYLVSMDDGCPRVVASTHFHEVFDLIQLGIGERVSYMKMQVYIHTGSESAGPHDADDVVYLYNLVQGRSSCSYGSYCASKNGIPASIVTRADQIAELISRGQDLAVTCAGLSSTDIEDLEDAETIARIFLSQDLSSVSALDQMLESLESNHV